MLVLCLQNMQYVKSTVFCDTTPFSLTSQKTHYFPYYKKIDRLMLFWGNNRYLL
jgi:hypothetical protein